MNQILSVESPQNRKKKGNRSNIHSILIVFSIILMIFGIGITSTGAYSYYKNLSNNLNNNITVTSNTKPKISTERESSSIINLVVTHDKVITKVTYIINDEAPVEINGANKTELKEQIELPVGESKLTITAEDIDGMSSSYQGSFSVEQKPTISLEQVEGKIQITTESTIAIDYIKYYWDENEQEAETITSNELANVTLVDVLEGTHTLNIEAIDIEGNKTTKTQKIIGDNKPELSVTTDGTVFMINAKDDENITKIEITLNTNEMETREVNQAEYSTTIDLVEGENRLTVTVYNQNGLTETSRVKYTKE